MKKRRTAATTAPHDLAADVRELNRRFRLGLFDGALFDGAEALLDRIGDRDPLNDALLLKARCVIAEILDQQGRLSLAQEAVREGATLMATLRGSNLTLEHPEDLRRMREQIRFVADFARFHLYRRAQYSAAKDYLDFCADVVATKLRRPTFNCHGSMGLIAYYTGCAERQLGNLDAADRSYATAINEYRGRAELALTRGDSLDEELALARHNTAVILGLGLGWTNSQRGLLTKALNSNIMPAQVLLMGSHDQTHRAYLSLIRGSIMRSLAGSSNPEVLDEATKSIEQADVAFTRHPYCHESYAMRAEYELALCALAGRNFDAALKWTNQVAERAQKLRDVRWQAMAWIVMSRTTHRRGGNAEEARQQAEAAIALMAGQEEALGLIDARVARADALLDLGQSQAARDDLNSALKIVEAQTRPNQKIESVLRIRLALSHLQDGNTRDAEAEYNTWDRCKENVEHALVHEMAQDVMKQLLALKRDFSISWATMDVRHADHERRLRAWLIRRAYHERGEKTKAEIAADLGIARPTLNLWEEDLKDEIRTLVDQSRS